MKDFKKAHQNMIFGQFLPNKLTSPHLLHAFEEVWRESFIPQESKPLSYCDQTIKITKGREMISALSLMRLLQAAKITRKKRVLNITSGFGYGSMVMSYLAKSVVCLEEDEQLYQALVYHLKGSSCRNIKPMQGNIIKGAQEHAPYDFIFIEGSCQEIPFSLLEQLEEGGALFAFEPLSKTSKMQLARAVQYVKNGKTYTKNYLFEAIAPQIAAFDKEPEFYL